MRFQLSTYIEKGTKKSKQLSIKTRLTIYCCDFVCIFNWETFLEWLVKWYVMITVLINYIYVILLVCWLVMIVTNHNSGLFHSIFSMLSWKSRKKLWWSRLFADWIELNTVQITQSNFYKIHTFFWTKRHVFALLITVWRRNFVFILSFIIIVKRTYMRCDILLTWHIRR